MGQVLQDSPPQPGGPDPLARDPARAGSEPPAAPQARATPDWRCSPLLTAGFRGVGRAVGQAGCTYRPAARLAARQPGREVGCGEEGRREFKLWERGHPSGPSTDLGIPPFPRATVVPGPRD